MKDKLESKWKDAIVAHVEVLSRYFPGGNEENNKKFRDIPFPDRIHSPHSKSTFGNKIRKPSLDWAH
jgi:hypothetical protein